MSFKEFLIWSNDRACDGCWSMLVAMTCIDIIKEIKKIPFWKREKYWENEYEKRVLDEIVTPINKKWKKSLEVKDEILILRKGVL